MEPNQLNQFESDPPIFNTVMIDIINNSVFFSGEMTNLMELDVSCNEIAHLPVQIGDLANLRSLHLRRNHLQEVIAYFFKVIGGLKCHLHKYK